MASRSRKADRVHFQHVHPVTLMAVDGTWRRTCILKDASDTGARLDVDGSTDVLTSREFFMVLSSTGLAYRRCELVWINGSTVGVHFVRNFGKESEPKSRARCDQVKLVCSRRIPALDTDTLECREAKEALFRNGNGFILYLSDGAPPPSCRERLILLSAREALLWLNEDQAEAGSFWQ